VSVANRYKLNKKFRKLHSKAEANPEDLTIKTQASSAQIGAEAENEDNVSEQQRQQGKKVLYGQIVQLQHMFTGKYIHVSTTQTSRMETSNMQVYLADYNAKHAQFRIMPRYKVKAEGDMVQVDDQIVLESVKSPGQFLHVSKAQFGNDSVYKGEHELNLSVRHCGFTIVRQYKPEKDHANYIKAGLPIRFFHKEVEAFLVAEGLFDDHLTEEAHLRLRPVDQNNPKSLFPSTSAITYWQIEMEDGAINGNVVKWGQQCRFKHMTTRRYLKVQAKTISLIEENDDPNSVFRLHPVIKEHDEIEFETYCRIEHVVSGCWLHAEQEEYKRKSGGKDDGGDMSMTGLQWTTAALRKIGVSEEMQYDDAFTMQKVDDNLVEIFNYMAGMVPFIQKLIADKKAGHHLNAKQAHDILVALKELKAFMIVNSVPDKQRQKLMRNLRIVELLVSLLQVPVRGSKDQRHMKDILIEGYDVLYTYLMGDSRKNELYIAKHIQFFESQISHEGEVGLNAAHMVMELVKDNRKIVDRITHKHIDSFVELLTRKKNYRYLDLLSVLCVCDGVSIPDNQNYITEAWLKKGQKNCVYHTELGQTIGKEKNVVYVSTNNKRVWTPLQVFVRQVRQRVKGKRSWEREE